MHDSPHDAVATDADVLILVGGLGTRLKSVIGDSTPKPLALVRGRPFLWYLMRSVAEQGFEKTILATSHLSEAFRSELRSYAPPEVDVRFSFESSPRGTGGAIVEALSTIETEPFVAMNGDSFIRVPLREMLQRHRDTGAVATIALIRVENVARFGTVNVNDDGSISAFLEKTGEELPGWINGGVYILSRQAFAPVLELPVSSIEKDVFPAWVGKGLQGFPVDSPFLDIGLPETYNAAAEFFKSCGYE